VEALNLGGSGLRRANEILKSAAAFFGAVLDHRGSK
jgi:hypothetical protein